MTPSEKPAMDAKEIRLRLREMAVALMGTASHCHCSFNPERLDGKPIYFCIYPYGYSDTSMNVTDFYDSFEELFEGFPKKYEAWRKSHHGEMLKKIALEIIRLTDLNGSCKESDLRMIKGVSSRDLDELSEAACAKANEMAGKGPFTIEKGAKGNAP